MRDFSGELKMKCSTTGHGISLDEFIDILDNYLVWYNEQRIKLSLGGMSPIEYRQSLGWVA